MANLTDGQNALGYPFSAESYDIPSRDAVPKGTVNCAASSRSRGYLFH